MDRSGGQQSPCWEPVCSDCCISRVLGSGYTLESPEELRKPTRRPHSPSSGAIEGGAWAQAFLGSPGEANVQLHDPREKLPRGGKEQLSSASTREPIEWATS